MLFRVTAGGFGFWEWDPSFTTEQEPGRRDVGGERSLGLGVWMPREGEQSVSQFSIFIFHFIVCFLYVFIHFIGLIYFRFIVSFNLI